MKIAILLTCFNRKEKTLSCLGKIYSQESIPQDTELCVILVDDGSTDGTGDAVREQFPQVQVLQGSGSLFWNGGMQLAFGEAMKQGYDYYLWMNDDTELCDNAIAHAVKCTVQLKNENRFILVGSTKDELSAKHTYGGVNRKKGIHPFKFEQVKPTGALQTCDTINGNFALISSAVTDVLGNLDPNYTHAFGDFDYGFRASKARIPLYVLPEYVGTCSNNSIKGTWNDRSLSFKERLRKRHSNTGVPFHNWVYFCRKHGGFMWPLWVISPYLKMLLQSLGKR